MPPADQVFDLTLPPDRPHLGLPMADDDLGMRVFGAGRILERCVNPVRIRLRSASARMVQPDPGDGSRPREIRLEAARELTLSGI